MNTSLIDNIGNNIRQFETITFKDIKEAKLMRRVDTKYVFGLDLLPQLLSQIKQDYYAVEIDGILMHDYETLYYDTSQYSLYTAHHNGVRSRYKVRFRKYVKSNLAFFEIKQKNNKNETIKSRIKHRIEDDTLSAPCLNLVDKKIPGFNASLYPSISNNFKRITLVNKNMPERVTIDFNIGLQNARLKSDKLLKHICVLELKRDLGTKNQIFRDTLNSLGIKPMGFSKYCMGVVMTNTPVKQNLFKPRIKAIYNLINE